MKKRDDKNKGKNKSNAPSKHKAKPQSKRVSNTTTLILCVAVPLLLSGFLNFFAHKRWILYFPLIGGLLLLGYLGHLAIRSYSYPKLDPGPRFSVTPEVLLIGHPAKQMNSIFWMCFSGLYISPVSICCYMRFTNHQSVPIMIESYAVEGKIENKWQKITRMDSGGKLFNIQSDGTAFARAIPLNFNAFDDIARDTNIGPGQTVHGWIFLELSEALESCKEWRFRMKSIDGIESTSPMTPDAKPDEDSIRGGMMQPTGTTVDISSLPRVVYSERESIIRKPTPTPTPMSNTNISSVNQKGGFTGVNQGTVNLGNVPLSLAETDKAKLVSELKSVGDKSLVLVISNPEGDNQRFKGEVLSVLEESGIGARDFGGFIMDGYEYKPGIELCFKTDKQQAQAKELYRVFTNAGIPCQISPGPKDIVALRISAKRQ